MMKKIRNHQMLEVVINLGLGKKMIITITKKVKNNNNKRNPNIKRMTFLIL